jgi:hypothetical protein
MGQQDDNQVQGFRKGKGNSSRNTGAIRSIVPKERGRQIMMMMMMTMTTIGKIVTAFLIMSGSGV